MADVAQSQIDNCRRRLKQVVPDSYDVADKNCFVGLDAYKEVILSGVDYVILATPPGFRPWHLEAAVAAGKNVFTEKPVAVDGPGIRKCFAVYEQAQQKGLSIGAGTQRRHQSGYLETIERIHNGDIGEILSARCYWNGQGIWFKPRQPGVTDVAYQLHNWYHFLWVCGDHICEQHVHNLDVINWVMNSHPVRCWGMGGRPTRDSVIAEELKKANQFNAETHGDPNVYGHIFDHFAVEYEYPNPKDKDAPGPHMFSQCRHIAGCWNSISEAVVGTKGSCQVDRYTITGEKAWRHRGKNNEPYVQEHTDLIESIRGGQPLNELKNVTESTLTAIMGRMAAYTGKEVSWEQALNSKLDTFPKNLSWDMKLPVSPTPVPGQADLV